MKATRITSAQLARAFNRDVEGVGSQLKKFLQKGDPTNTQDLRKAAKRLGTSYSVLPKRLRQKGTRVRRYASASARLAKDMGEVRDLDTIATWTATQVAEGRDKRSFTTDLERMRVPTMRRALLDAKRLLKRKVPSVDSDDIDENKIKKRIAKMEKRLARRVDKEFEEFLSTQEVEVMHSLRKDSKRLRHLLELSLQDAGRGEGGGDPERDTDRYEEDGSPRHLISRLRSIQDDLGAIRDHDIVIDYLRSRVRLTSTRSLIREEIAKRHARLEDFVIKNRGQGRVV
jgi:CHAD domain-containing protein